MTTESNYVFVDVDGVPGEMVVRVYDHLGEMDAVTFVSDPSLVEDRCDRAVADPVATAYAFAELTAKKLGCDWGSNA